MNDRSRRGAQTQIIAATHARRLAVFRHEVDVIATRIVADAERMLRAAAPEHASWRDAIGRALLAGRHAASLCNVAIAAEGDAAAGQLAALETNTRASLQPAVDAMGEILRHVPMSVADELIIADARSIRAMAATAQALTSGDPEKGRVTREVPVRESAATETIGATEEFVAFGAGADGEELMSKARILIADDTPEILKTVERMLAKMGHDVTTAADGREALAAAHASPPDVVITDIDMPEMDGLELLAAIKADDALRHIPVIVVSGASDAERIAASLELGADDHIAKPFQQAQLRARVRSSLARKRLRAIELAHLRRVAQITAAAEAVDRDTYVPGSLAELARGGDRLAHLARVFDRMVLHMRSREDRLRARLRRLGAEMAEVTSSGISVAVPSAESPYASGQTLAGRYDIVGEVGRGGMGVVYHAVDRQLHEDVALKIVRADLVSGDPTLIDRLKTEIRLARKLSHPNVLRSHDLGEFAGTFFISMEYVRGVTLLEMLDQRGRLSPDSTVALGIQLADALAAAHAEQIIHRDIKPANLLMDERGTLKVMDFGLAKVIASEHGHTMRGVAVGTPQYMSPEQLMGGTLDARSDLFAVGVVLYECLTGRTPFSAESPVSLVAQLIDGDYARLRTMVPDVPAKLEGLIDSLLQLQPEARPQSATDLSRRLAEIDLVSDA